MKKNITINLCGRLYQIDEDAYELLHQYVESLRQSFGHEEGGEEIVNDIESRIAELFDELKQQGIEAITIDHVKSIITRIGRPEELTGEGVKDEDDHSAPHDDKGQGGNTDWQESVRSAAQDIFNNVRARTAGKKLYRNSNDKMVAGVLSGIAAYTNTDPVIWRLLFVALVFCYGIGIIAYIVLALVLPEAKSPEQLLQMKGRDVTPQNLADVVVEKEQQPVRRPTLIRMFFSMLLKIFLVFFVAIALMVCVLLCLGFLFALVVMVSALVLPVSSSMPFSLEAMGMVELYQTKPIVLVIFAISLMVLLLIPIYAIIHMALSVAGKVQPMGALQRIVCIVLWVVALCAIVPCSITMSDYNNKHYSRKYHDRTVRYYQGTEMDNEDADFLRQGGWNLVKGENCAHYTYSGQYYNGDESVRYLDAWNENCQEIYQVERKEAVEPGVYRLECIARAEGPGPCIYAIGDTKQVASIPVYGDSGGELIVQIREQMADSLSANPDKQAKKRTSMVMKMMGMMIEYNEDHPDVDGHDRLQDRRVMKGYGWSVVSIDNIEVTGDSIAYGVSTDETFTGKPCRAQWFSATDFVLTRTGDLRKSTK